MAALCEVNLGGEHSLSIDSPPGQQGYGLVRLDIRPSIGVGLHDEIITQSPQINRTRGTPIFVHTLVFPAIEPGIGTPVILNNSVVAFLEDFL